VPLTDGWIHWKCVDLARCIESANRSAVRQLLLTCLKSLGTSRELRRKGKAAANLRLCPFDLFEWVYLLVVLVLVDALADAVLALVQVAPFGLGQMAVVLCHIRLLPLLHAGVAALQIGSLLRT
jgi:hypothetical protein